MIKSRRMRLAGQGARMEEEKCILYIGGKARRKETTNEDQDVGGWIILKWILGR
jgi:hypothetical protein